MNPALFAATVARIIRELPTASDWLIVYLATFAIPDVRREAARQALKRQLRLAADSRRHEQLLDVAFGEADRSVAA